MKIEIKRNDFSDIKTAVFYKFHKYLPNSIDYSRLSELQSEVIGSENFYKSQKLEYQGENGNFPSMDFAEYDFSYLIKKYKFNNIFSLLDLSNESREVIGNDSVDTNKISKVLFPTLVYENLESDFSYFGVFPVSGSNLFFFDTPQDYYKIELYEDSLNCNNNSGDFVDYDYMTLVGNYDSIISPSIIITLGPELDLYNNSDNFYFDLDPLKIRRKEPEYKKSLPSYDYSKLVDEIYSKKVIYTLISTNNSILEFNLAYSTWNNNQNAHRNKDLYSVRNDEFYNSCDNIDVVEKIGGFWVDRKSNTILGNKNNSVCPILNRKLNICKENSDIYSPYRIYMKGDITTFNSEVWESLSDWNIGNDPKLSSKWILSNKFLEFISNIIQLNINPTNTGTLIDPYPQVTITSNSDTRFSIINGLGYKFSDILELSEDNYEYFIEETNREYNQYIRINNWVPIIDPESPLHTENLTFNFEPEPTKILLKALKDGEFYDYSSWSDLGLSIDFKVSGDSVEISEDGIIEIQEPYTNPNINIEVLGDLLLRNIISEFRIGNIKRRRVLNNNQDIVDFDTAIYIFEVDSLERHIVIKTPGGYDFESTDIVVEYNRPYTFNFSLTDPEHFIFMPLHIDYFVYDSNGRIVRQFESQQTIEEPGIVHIPTSISGDFITAEFSIVGNNFSLNFDNVKENLFITLNNQMV